jgi:hypothetical protein
MRNGGQMKTKMCLHLGLFLLLIGILAIGQGTAASVSDYSKGYFDQAGWSGLSAEKSVAVSDRTNASAISKTFLITDIPGSLLPDVDSLISKKIDAPVEWDAGFMSKTSRYARYIPSCRIL